MYSVNMDSSDQQSTQSAPAPEKSGLKDISLRAAGYSYLLGDAAIFTAGIMEKNYNNALTGLTWGLGGLAAARYGNPKPEKQLELLERRLGAYLKTQHVAIPNDPTTATLSKEAGLIDHIEDFLYQHPSETLNAVYALGATSMIGGAIAKKNAITGKRSVAVPDLASGLLVGAGALSGLLINEKKPDPNKPPHGFFEQAMAWAQEKPLRVSGYLYAANNISMILGAFEKRKIPGNKSHVLRFATAASYVFANMMLSLSSKENISDKNPEVTAKLAETSAKVIAAQPPETQEALLQNIAGYLAAQPGMKQTAAELAELFHAKLKALAPSQPQSIATSEKTWEGKVAQNGLAAAPSL